MRLTIRAVAVGCSPLVLFSSSTLVRSLMVLQCLRAGAVKDFLGTGCFIHGTMGNQDKMNAEPNNIPYIPPQKAPIYPQ